MTAPELISWEVFIVNVEASDLHAMALLASGETVKTTDPQEAEQHKIIGDRLYGAGVLRRFRQSIEVIGGETWYVTDGSVTPAALVYVARCASERVMLSRSPEIPT